MTPSARSLERLSGPSSIIPVVPPFVRGQHVQHRAANVSGYVLDVELFGDRYSVSIVCHSGHLFTCGHIWLEAVE